MVTGRVGAVFSVRPTALFRTPVRLAIRACSALTVVSVVILGWSAAASATWSIVAIETETGRVGAAMASCVPSGVLGNSDEVLVPVVLVPGIGAAVTQGSIEPESPIGLRQLLSDGAEPRQAIDSLLEIDDQPTARQYAVVTIGPDGQGLVAAHTGADTAAERGDRTVVSVAGPDGASTFTVSVQGVLMADQAVLDQSLSAFTEAVAAGQPFEQALVDGLVAGSEAGGDRRCEDQTALFAHLAVAEAGDEPTMPSTLLTVTVDEGDGQNPVPELAVAYADGRSGWVDIGLNDPLGVPRIAVLAVGTILAIAAFFTLRKGLGTPSARR